MSNKDFYKHKKPKLKTTAGIVHPNSYHIYTDGSFRPPDCAALAYLIYSEKSNHIVAMGREAHSGATNNQMELLAVDRALSFNPMKHVIIYTDSTYVIGCLSLWCKAWVRNNWISPLGEPVKNKAILEPLIAKLATKESVNFVKVKAHTGDPFNSMVDYLCQDLTAKMTQQSIPNGSYPLP